MSSRRCCDPPALACHVRLAPTCARSRAHSPCAPRFHRIRSNRRPYRDFPARNLPPCGTHPFAGVEVFPRGGRHSGRVAKGIRITSELFTYSNAGCCSVIRVCYDSPINMIAPITSDPAALLSFRHQSGGCGFLFHVSRPLLKRFYLDAAERLMRRITRCRPNRLRSRPSNP